MTQLARQRVLEGRVSVSTGTPIASNFYDVSDAKPVNFWAADPDGYRWSDYRWSSVANRPSATDIIDYIIRNAEFSGMSEEDTEIIIREVIAVDIERTINRIVNLNLKRAWMNAAVLIHDTAHAE